MTALGESEPEGSTVEELAAARAERLDHLARRRTSSTASPGAAPAAGPATSLPRPASPRRRHPARAARFAALVMSLTATGGLTYELASLSTSRTGGAQVAAGLSGLAATVPDSPLPPGGAGRSPSITAAPATGDGTTLALTGDVVSTRYGPIQVQVRMAGGAITDIAVPRYPDGAGQSIAINARALPSLRTATLSAQSAEVDTVSGATYTSVGYRKSLQSALDRARVSGASVIQ